MSSNYEELTCQGCAGTLEYIREKKIWRCRYCGREIRRVEQYDGLYTIKNVVRQTLADIANGSMDLSRKNLAECQKISGDYVGTVIAELCFDVFTISDPSCSQSERKSLFGQVKRLCEKLRSIDSGISAEEEALYESFEGKGDVFGVLIIAFDSVQAVVHRDFVQKMLDISSVYSRSINEKLMNYALKNEQTEMADGIFSNVDNINCRDMLFILLERFPDGEEKQAHLRAMLEKAEISQDDVSAMEEYLQNTGDCTETKALLFELAAARRAAPAAGCMLKYILSDPEIADTQIARVIAAFCQSKPNDSELYELISDIFYRQPGGAAVLEMNCLTEQGIFIKLNDKLVRGMINRQDWTLEQRLTMLQFVQTCNLDAKAKDAVIGEILLKNTESTDTRMALMQAMLPLVNTISTGVVTEYILKCGLDGERKPEMLQLILTLNLNMSYFRDVLDLYIPNARDSEATKNRVIELLSGGGLCVSGSVLLRMAIQADQAHYIEVVGFIARAVQAGSIIGPDFLNQYLEHTAPRNLHGELAAELAMPSSVISDLALERYVLYMDEQYEVKLQNSLAFARANGHPFGSSACTIQFLGRTVRCNLFQAYVLTCRDTPVTVLGIVDAMKAAKAKLNPVITVNGATVKFKKFVTENKSALSQMTLSLCEANNVFSMFF